MYWQDRSIVINMYMHWGDKGEADDQPRKSGFPVKSLS